MTLLAITGVGVVSSVGGGSVETCASIRAGISRPRPVASFTTLDEETYDAKPLTGHPVHGVTDGFGPTARWSVLCQRAVSDLGATQTSSDAGDATEWSSCGVVFVLPVLEDARFSDVLPATPANIWRSCLDPLIAEWGIAANRRHRQLVAVGAAGTFRALEIAAGWLETRELERVLVVAVDSLLDAWSLSWLAEWGRLKDGTNPVGLAAGEASVALFLERWTRGTGTPPLAALTAYRYAEVDEPFQNAERRLGKGLTAALLPILEQEDQVLEGDLYINLNGEDWRGAELGSALASLPEKVRGSYRVVAPATSLGDIGTAAGALQIACAVRSFARGYGSRSQAWVVATSDDGDVGVARLQAV